MYASGHSGGAASLFSLPWFHSTHTLGTGLLVLTWRLYRGWQGLEFYARGCVVRATLFQPHDEFDGQARRVCRNQPELDDSADD